MKRVAIALLMTAAALVLRADQGINQKKGFNADNVYHVNDIDAINAFNGNLTVTVPLGPRFPIADGLSYGLTAVSNGNVWEPENLNEPPDLSPNARRIASQADELCHPDDGVMFAHPHRRANAGLGWIVTFGRLLDPNYPLGEPVSEWIYESPDGSDHKFGDGTSGSRTWDGTNLRLLYDAALQTRTVEFPDGTKHTFKATTMGGPWLPTRIENRYGAYLKIDYYGPGDTIPNGGGVVPAGTYRWLLEDSHGRHHVVKFIKKNWEGGGRYLIDRIELAAFNGTVATYIFRYTERQIGRQDWSEWCTGYNVKARIQTLDRIEFPDDPGTESEGTTQYSFVYDNRVDWLGPSGSLLEATLPTGARIQWSYTQYMQARFTYAAPTPWIDFSWGVGTRKLLPPLGGTGPTRTWTYFYHLNADYDPGTIADNDEMVHQGRAWMQDPAGNLTLSLFSSFVCVPTLCTGAPLPYYWSEYGKPFDREHSDGGMYLSEVQYPPGVTVDFDDPLEGAIRAKYVRYESDVAPDQNEPLEDNSRMAATRIKHFDPVTGATTEWVDTLNTNWDGFGHYEVTEVSGSTTTKRKKTTTNYNPHLTASSVVPLDKPWLVNTFSTAETEYDGQVSKIEACFQKDSGGVYPSTGFMTRKRAFRGGAANKDLLTAYTATAHGNVASEKFYGGDYDVLSDPSNTCGMTLGTAPFTLNHTYSFGVLSQSQYAGASFKSLDLTVDPSGLSSLSSDTAGVTTKFEYNPAGQLRKVIPKVDTTEPDVDPGGWTEYQYNVDPQATPPGSVTVKQWPSSITNPGSNDVPLTESRYSYDASGRLVQQATWLGGLATGANGASRWAVSTTTYDELGRKWKSSVPVSRLSGAFATFTAAVTEFTYDALGRVTKVKQPDNSEVNTAYPTPSKPTRTSSVQSVDSNGVDVVIPVSTREEYDPFGRLTTVTENFGGINPIVTEYEYDEGDRLVKVIAGVQERKFNYDGAGLLTSEEHPESNTTTYSYDSRGHVRQQVAANTAVVLSNYDPAERLTSITHNGNMLKSFTYDTGTMAQGKVATATRVNDHGTVGTYTVKESFEYEPVTGRVAAKTTEVVKVRNSVVESTIRFKDGYEYDELGANTSVTYPECTTGCGGLPPLKRIVQNDYSQGLLKSVPGYTGDFTYHPNGLIADFSRVNVNGSVGPRYEQTVANGLPRPASINVTGDCSNLTIDTHPQATKTVSVDAEAGLTVAATGATGYQWYAVGSSTVLDTDATLNATVNQTTSYFVRVLNATCSVDSRVSVVSVAGTLPTVMTGTASSITQTSATLNGTVNPNGSSTTTSFEYGTTTSYGTTTTPQTLTGSSAQSIFAPMTSLVCGTTYHFRAKASNAGGTSNGSDATFATSACTQTPAPTVTTGSATSVGQTAATFNGTVNPNGSSSTTSFEYGTTTAYGSTVDAQTRSGTTSQSISASVSSLTCNTTYHFRATASNAGGSGAGSDAVFTTSPCTGPPPTVSTSPANLIGETTATLYGSVNPNGSTATTGFDYGYTTSYGSTVSAQPKSGSSSSQISAPVSNLSCDTTYHFRARATNAGGTNVGQDRLFITAACTTGACAPEAIAYGLPVTRTLSESSCRYSPTGTPHYLGIFQFAGTAGDIVQIDMTSYEFNTLLDLRAPNGQSAAVNDDWEGSQNHSRVTFTLTSSGTWTIRATTFNLNETGSYDLSVFKKCAPEAITPPVSLARALTSTSCSGSPRGQGYFSGAYTFSGSTGQTLTIEMTSSFDTYLYLVAPDGSVFMWNDDISTNNFNSRIVAVLPSVGTWTIYATTYQTAITGSYQLSVGQLNCPTATAFGTHQIPQSGSQVIAANLTGTPPWTVAWSNGEVTANIQSSPATLTVWPQITTHYTVTSVTDSTGCSRTGSGEAVVTVVPPAPTQLSATATTTASIQLGWSYSGSAGGDFTVERCAAACSLPASWTLIGTPTQQTLVDGERTANKSYLYRVRARKGGTSSLPSAVDVATTVMFGSDVVVGGLVDDANVLQLRTAVQAMALLAGSSSATFTGTNLANTLVLSVHMSEMRTALAAARSNLGLVPASYSPASLSTRAADINELRGAAR